MKPKSSMLFKYLLGLKGPVDAAAIPVPLRAHILSEECVEIVESWPLKTIVKTVQDLQKLPNLKTVLPGKTNDSAKTTLTCTIANVRDLIDIYNMKVQNGLYDALELVATKSWEMDNLSYETVLNPETEANEIAIINHVQPEQFSKLPANQLRSIVKTYAEHPWLSKHFEASDSDACKLHKTVLKIRKRAKNREDARRSRDKKRKAAEFNDERNKKRHQQLCAARDLAMCQDKSYSLRTHKHFSSWNKKLFTFF